MDGISYQEALIRLLLAVLVGGIVGYQREKHERPAGLRTHILVALGSTLVMLVSAYGFLGQNFADPTRIASQVVVGVGFLGAGTIIRQGSLVIGLTTAASLWTTAAAGLALGLGWYRVAIFTVLLVFLVLSLFKKIEEKYWKRHLIQLEIVGSRAIKGLREKLPSKGFTIEKLEKKAGKEEISYLILAEAGPHLDLTEIVEKLSSLRGVKKVSWSREL